MKGPIGILQATPDERWVPREASEFGDCRWVVDIKYVDGKDNISVASSCRLSLMWVCGEGDVRRVAGWAAKLWVQ